ncbi:MAG: carboxypeptidase regulatory-like domain-containing protein, partial [Pyrinomonadaceae bacterium]|nr:carboxypeptidase regulatory-like domain-containing protein [Pyrinomonadaceae bacterium]
MSYRRHAALLCSIALLIVPLFTALAAYAGGQITGTVTDPKGAVINGAAITVIDAVSSQSFTTVTDKDGRYKVEGLPPGGYNVTISAQGFGDVRRENIRVEEGATVTFDARLEVAAFNAGEVTVTSGTRVSRANTDPLYRQLRQQAGNQSDFSQVASVNNLVLKRDGATFSLRSGELYFLAPVEGRATGAVFFGDGEVTLTPPVENEKRSLRIFTGELMLREQFTQLVMRFSDQTLDEVKKSPNVSMTGSGAQASHARDVYRDNQYLMRKRLRFKNLELRTLADLYAPQRPGFFMAFIQGRRYSKLAYTFDPLGIPEVSPEEVALLSYGDSDGGIWTAFHSEASYSNNTANSRKDHRLFDITRHEIETVIRGTQMTASDRVTFRALKPGVRVLPFDLYRSLRVNRVQDEAGRDLDFVQENKDEDADFGVVLPQALEVGKTYKLVVEYAGGDALRDSGGGNFILLPSARASWYPNNGGTQFGDRARFDITFRYPKSNMLISVGAPAAPDVQEGDARVSRWSSGDVELAVAGFNYGRFKKKEQLDKDTGYNIEFYANEEVPDELKAYQLAIEQAESSGVGTNTTLGSVSTSKMGAAAITDAQNSMRIYNAFFGKLPYSRVAMSQQPAANFGQAWPTLVFMPYTAFINATQRRQMFGSGGSTSSFWRYVGPHEVAHQWWGHIIGWTSYRDQWMSEGFAEFSTSLYAQYVRRDPKEFTDFWEEQRKEIIEASPLTRGRRPYTVGPITQGYRLSSAKTGGAYRVVYPKGAYILHMLRMMMYDPQQGGDKRFKAMMQDFVQSNFNRDVS